jgi:Icc-related predicted phosphoesterase
MKALVFTDTHHHMPSIKKIAEKIKDENPDILLCCGDFTIFMNGYENFLDWLNNFNIPCYLIHGNHEDEDEIKQTCEKLKNIFFIHKKIVSHNNLIIMGYGGDGFSIEDPKFKVVAKKFEKEFNNNNNNKVKILLLHQPPYKSGIDFIYNDYAGNKTTKDFILKNKIKYVFAGHLHENSGLSFDKKGIKYINPGPEGMIFKFQ